MKTLVEGKFGHGAIKSSFDVRDHKASRLGMASAPFNWDVGYDVNVEVPTEDQNGSYSCGGQALRYYLEVIDALEKKSFAHLSAKDPYCQIFYPGGGTTMRDIGRLAVKGIRTESIVPSYENGNPPSEWFMEDKTASNTALPVFFKADAYAFTKIDIDSIAQAIKDNNGCIIEVHGEDNGTWHSTYPNPPLHRYGGWNHFVYAGKVKKMNGIRYVGIHNSWGNIGDNGWQWLSEDFFKGSVQGGLVLYKPSVTPYIPSPIQSSISSMPSWVVRLFNWLGNYLH